MRPPWRPGPPSWPARRACGSRCPAPNRVCRRPRRQTRSCSAAVAREDERPSREDRDCGNPVLRGSPRGQRPRRTVRRPRCSTSMRCRRRSTRAGSMARRQQKAKATGPGRSGSAEVDEPAAILRRVRRKGRHERAGANDGERSAKQLAKPGTTHQLSGERPSIRRGRRPGGPRQGAGLGGPGILRSLPVYTPSPALLHPRHADFGGTGASGPPSSGERGALSGPAPTMATSGTRSNPTVPHALLRHRGQKCGGPRSRWRARRARDPYVRYPGKGRVRHRDAR